MIITGPMKSAKINSECLANIVSEIMRIPGVGRVFLFGARAGAGLADARDADLAVFFDTEKTCLRDEYRQLLKICESAKADIRAQVFHLYDLLEPSCIIEGILTHGVDLPLPMPI